MIKYLVLFFWFALFVSQSGMDAGATLMAISAIWMLCKSADDRARIFPSLKKNPLVWLFVAWLAVIAIGLFVIAPPEAPRWELFAEFRWMLELGLWIYLLQKITWTERDEKWFLLPPLLSAIYGLCVLASHYDWLYPDESPDRVGGLIGNPMPFAHTEGPLAAGLCAVLLLALLRGRKMPVLFWITTILSSVAVLLSMTRGIWVGLFVVAVITPLALRIRRSGLIILGLVVVTAVLSVSVPFLRDRLTQAFDPSRSYDSQRVALWEANVTIAKEHPVFGLGYTENRRRLREYFDRMNLPPGQFESHAHNQYLHFLAGTGALGLLCYLLFIGGALAMTWRMVRATSGVFFFDAAAIGLLAAQIVFEIGSFTESNFSVAKNRYFILLVIACVFALRAKFQRGRLVQETSRPRK